ELLDRLGGGQHPLVPVRDSAGSARAAEVDAESATRSTDLDLPGRNRLDELIDGGQLLIDRVELGLQDLGAHLDQSPSALRVLAHHVKLGLEQGSLGLEESAPTVDHVPGKIQFSAHDGDLGLEMRLPDHESRLELGRASWRERGWVERE